MYSSDMTDVQWARLESLLERPRGDRHTGGRPRKYELRRVVDALLYVVKTGFVPLSKTGAELLFELLSQRYERASTLVTSNLPFAEWKSSAPSGSPAPCSTGLPIMSTSLK